MHKEDTINAWNRQFTDVQRLCRGEDVDFARIVIGYDEERGGYLSIVEPVGPPMPPEPAAAEPAAAGEDTWEIDIKRLIGPPFHLATLKLSPETTIGEVKVNIPDPTLVVLYLTVPLPYLGPCQHSLFIQAKLHADGHIDDATCQLKFALQNMPDGVGLRQAGLMNHGTLQWMASAPR